MKKLLTFVVGISFLITCACGVRDLSKTASNAPISESRSLSGFIGIKASGAFSLIVTVGDDYSVVLEGDQASLANVVTGVDEGMLIIKYRTPTSTTNKVRLKITMPETRKLEFYGSTDAEVFGIKGSNTELSANGRSTITAAGSVATLKAEAVGASNVDASKLLAESVTATATGASEITVSASKELTAEALGASNIYYLGDPKVTKNAVGASEIRKK